MDIGQYDQRVQLLVRAPGEAENGEPNGAWVNFGSERWANVRNRGGLETIKADTVTSTVRTSIRVFFCQDIVADMRLQHRSTLYDIKAVLPDWERQQHVDLVCEVL